MWDYLNNLRSNIATNDGANRENYRNDVQYQLKYGNVNWYMLPRMLKVKFLRKSSCKPYFHAK